MVEDAMAVAEKSLTRAQPLFDHGYSITGLKLVKAVAGLKK
jgi:hypothetical protein